MFGSLKNGQSDLDLLVFVSKINECDDDSLSEMDLIISINYKTI